MLPQHLIESALALTGKSKTYCHELDFSVCDDEEYDPSDYNDIWDYPSKFSIEKFCYYLLSKNFINSYEPYFWIKYKECMRYRVWHAFQEAITAYQYWNEEPLISLLEKIWTNQ